MNSSRVRRRLAMLASAGLATLAACGGSGSPPDDRPSFSHPREIDNRYLPITTTKRCEHRGQERDGTRTRSVQTVLERTKRLAVHGQKVDAVVVRDNSYEDGELVETAYDYFAQADDGTVYYLGEDVHNIKDGKVTDHDGTWLVGRHTKVPGVAMPASPKLGEQYRFEDVPGVTSESNKVEEVGMRAKAAGELHTGVIRISEFIQPEGEVEQKLYAPGVGKVAEYPPTGRAELAGCR